MERTIKQITTRHTFASRLREVLPPGRSASATCKAMRDEGYKISQQMMSDMLCGAKKPSLRMATQIADYFEIDLNWLAGREWPPNEEKKASE
ncbi:MAG: helix-turn-helix domain-containing protein [Gammaproteobacteria bacterium]